MVPVTHNHPDTHDLAAHGTSSSQNRFTPLSLATFGLTGQSKALTDDATTFLQTQENPQAKNLGIWLACYERACAVYSSDDIPLTPALAVAGTRRL